METNTQKEQTEADRLPDLLDFNAGKRELARRLLASTPSIASVLEDALAVDAQLAAAKARRARIEDETHIGVAQAVDPVTGKPLFSNQDARDREARLRCEGLDAWRAARTDEAGLEAALARLKNRASVAGDEMKNLRHLCVLFGPERGS